MSEANSSCSSSECYASTSILVKNFSFNWTIENFSKFPFSTTKTSPKFHPLPNHAFKLTLHLLNDLVGFIGIRKTLGKAMQMKCCISKVSGSGRIHRKSTIMVSTNRKTIELRLNAHWFWILLQARKENVLTIQLVMEFLEDDESEIYHFYPKPQSLLEDRKALSSDLRALYITSHFADINLKVGGNVVRAHKPILIARSPVFARTLETPMHESVENIINITDLELPVLKDLVSYLYTGVLPNEDFENVCALYYAADKYDVSILRKTCVNTLLSKLAIENSCRALVLADRHSDVEFKDSVMTYMDLHFDEIQNTYAWKELVEKATPLAAEVLAFQSKKRKRDESIKAYGSTRISMRKFTFNWTIKNFSKCPVPTVKASPKFHPMPNHAFNLTLYLLNDSSGYIGIHKTLGKSLQMKYCISKINRSGRMQRKSNIMVNSNSKTIQLFLNNNWQSILIQARKENVLTIRLVMEFWEDDESEIYQFFPKPNSLLDDLNSLSGDLKSLHDASQFADVTLKVGENVVCAHKCILIARSSVLARTLETPMNERDENVINITDLELPVLKDLVMYMYTGVLNKDDFDTLYDLYYAADKYDMSMLRQTCVNILLSKLAIENSCRVLALADRHSDIEFKDSVMAFIKLHFDKVQMTYNWKELIENATALAAEVMALQSKKRKRDAL